MLSKLVALYLSNEALPAYSSDAQAFDCRGASTSHEHSFDAKNHLSAQAGAIFNCGNHAHFAHF